MSLFLLRSHCLGQLVHGSSLHCSLMLSSIGGSQSFMGIGNSKPRTVDLIIFSRPSWVDASRRYLLSLGVAAPVAECVCSSMNTQCHICVFSGISTSPMAPIQFQGACANSHGAGRLGVFGKASCVSCESAIVFVCMCMLTPQSLSNMVREDSGLFQRFPAESRGDPWETHASWGICPSVCHEHFSSP